MCVIPCHVEEACQFLERFGFEHPLRPFGVFPCWSNQDGLVKYAAYLRAAE